MDYQEIENQQIHRLQIYCEQHVKLGDIVADRFNAEWMDDCWEYIKEQVQKDCESGKGAQIWHTAIYRLCRDYFNDNLHEVRAKEKAEKEAKEKERIANVKAQNKAAKAKAEKDAKKLEAKMEKAEKKAPKIEKSIEKFAKKYKIDVKSQPEVKQPSVKQPQPENKPEPGQLDFLALLGV